MDIYQLRYFLAIVETGGFTRAAERLFVSQPSLSVGIKKLEQELGVTLFERGGRKALLTTAGKVFAEKAQSILQEYQATLQALKGFHDQPCLRIGVLQTIRINTLAGLIRDFQSQCPNVLIELLDGSVEDLRNWLEQGEIDVAIATLAKAESTKNALPLFQQRRLLAVASSHPFAQRGTVRLAELNGQPYIDRVHCELWKETQELLLAKKVQPRTVYRANQEEWVLSLVSAGLGIAITPEWKDISTVVYVPILDLSLQRTIGLTWRLGQDSQVIDEFRTFATTHNW